MCFFMKKYLILFCFLVIMFFSTAIVFAADESVEITQSQIDVSDFDGSLSSTQNEYFSSGQSLYVNDSIETSGSGTRDNPYKSISDAVSMSNDGDVIFIAPGNYSGSENIALEISNQITLKSYGDGEVILDGEENSWILYVTASNVTIDGLTFKNGNYNYGAAIYYESTSTDNLINNSKFMDNSASYGGAIYFSGDRNSKIVNCVFENNTADYGGAVYFYSTSYNTSFTKNRFKNNNATYNGGAVCYYYGSNNNSFNYNVFSNNSVVNWNGGAIYIYESSNDKFINNTFENNHAGWGGAILFGYNSINSNFTNSSFSNNHAVNHGGAIYFYYDDDSYLNQCDFINNTANYGGAVYIYTTTVIQLSNGEFSNNSALYGAGIYSWDSDNLNLTNILFKDNKAQSQSLVLSFNKFNKTVSAQLRGGNNMLNALYVPSVEDLILDNVTYWSYGGFISSDDAEVPYSNIEQGQNITFELSDNSTGELLFNETKTTDVNGNVDIDYSQLSQDVVYKYIVYHDENSYYTYISSTGEFNPQIGDFELLQKLIDDADENDIINLTRNFTYTIGVDNITNGVQIDKNNLTINLNNFTINALGESRIFNVKSQSVNIINGTLINANNSAIYFTGDLNNTNIINVCFINNTAVNGGVIYANSIQNTSILNCKFINNSASSSMGITYGHGAVLYAKTLSDNNISNNLFIKNNAGNYGGAIYITSKSSNNDFMNNTFISNKASNNYGGAIYIKTSVNDKFTDSKFINNSVVNYGSSLSFDSSSSNIFSNNLFSNNTGGYGAIYAKYSYNNSILNSNFTNNNGSQSGGIYFGTSINNTLSQNLFENNYARKNGAAIQFASSLNDNITGSIFSNNTAENNGGAIYISDESNNMYLSDNTFKLNNATVNGGAISFNGESKNITLANNSFTANHAGKGGAVIFAEESQNVNLLQSNFTNNTANYGGALNFNNEISYVNIISCIFDNNTLPTNGTGTYTGGAIDFTKISSNILINNSEFKNNYAGYGGAVNFNSNGNTNLTLINSQFSSNSAKYWGGAIRAQYLNGSNFYNLTFSENSAITNGIIYFLFSYNNTINKSSFLDNDAQAIINFYNSNDDCNIVNSIFINNTCNKIINSDGNKIIANYNWFGLNATDYMDTPNISPSIVADTWMFLNATVNPDEITVGEESEINFILQAFNSTSNSTDNYDNGLFQTVNMTLTAINGDIDVNSTVLDNDIIYTAEHVNNGVITSIFKSTQYNIGIIINPSNSSVSVDDVEVKYGDIICLSADVVNASQITTKIYDENNSEVQTNLTVDGFNITISGLKAGNYILNTTTVVSDDYLPVTVSSEILVDKSDITLIITNATDINPKENEVLHIELSDYEIDGELIFSVNNVSQGLIDNYTIFLSNLGEGNYTVLVELVNDSNYNYAFNSSDFTVLKISDYDVNIDMNNSMLIISLCDDATGNITVQIDDIILNSTILNGTALINCSDLEAGVYDLNISYSGDDCYTGFVRNINLTVNVNLIAPDVVKYYSGPEKFNVYLTDNKNNSLSGQEIRVVINGMTYYRIIKDNASAAIALNLLPGDYAVLVSCDALNISTNSNVTIKKTINASDIVKVYRNGTQFYATLYDAEGNYLPDGSAVDFNINGIIYTRYTGENGLVKLNINLLEGDYIVTTNNPITNENFANKITVLPKIIDNEDLVKFYRNASQYIVRLVDDNNNPVGAGETVTFNINGVLYNRTTNSSGHAKLNINLHPGEYIVTADYNGFEMSNNIVVKTVLIADNLTKKYGSSDQFTVKVLDGQGNPLSDAQISFNINGVFYTRTSNSSGISALNINLPAGEYIITSSYDGLSISNTIVVTDNS